MPRRIALLIALLMVAAAGFAQSAGNVFIGYSLNHANAGWGNSDNLNGWELSAEGKIAPFVSIVGDIGATYGTGHIPTEVLFGGPGLTPAQTRVVTYMAGPRVSVSVGPFRPFAHAMVGLGHLHQDTSQFESAYSYGESCVADAVGGGVDYKLIRFAALRIQGDALQTRFHGGRQTDARISAGFVLRF